MQNPQYLKSHMAFCSYYENNILEDFENNVTTPVLQY